VVGERALGKRLEALEAMTDGVGVDAERGRCCVDRAVVGKKTFDGLQDPSPPARSRSGSM
jgi:hypothetical protein